jgi:hypothetical protein
MGAFDVGPEKYFPITAEARRRSSSSALWPLAFGLWPFGLLAFGL